MYHYTYKQHSGKDIRPKSQIFSRSYGPNLAHLIFITKVDLGSHVEVPSDTLGVYGSVLEVKFRPGRRCPQGGSFTSTVGTSSRRPNGNTV